MTWTSLRDDEALTHDLRPRMLEFGAPDPGIDSFVAAIPGDLMTSAPQSLHIGTIAPTSITPAGTGPSPGARSPLAAGDAGAAGAGAGPLHDSDQREASPEQAHVVVTPTELASDLAQARRSLAKRDATIAQLRQAVTSRDVIGQAKGILMERLKVTASEAFTMLIDESNHHNRRLVDIAERLVHSGGDITSRRSIPTPAQAESHRGAPSSTCDAAVLQNR